MINTKLKELFVSILSMLATFIVINLLNLIYVFFRGMEFVEAINPKRILMAIGLAGAFGLLVWIVRLIFKRINGGVVLILLYLLFGPPLMLIIRREFNYWYEYFISIISLILMGVIYHLFYKKLGRLLISSPQKKIRNINNY